jgi:ankyrin repeat protein
MSRNDSVLLVNAPTKIRLEQNKDAAEVPPSATMTCNDNRVHHKAAQQSQSEPIHRGTESSASSPSSTRQTSASEASSSPMARNQRTTTTSVDLLPQIVELIHDETLGESRWKEVLDMIEADPSLARRPVPVVCQGENSTGFLVHYLVSSRRRNPTPVSILDALVTAYPMALSHADPRGGRLPLHMAVFLPFCSASSFSSRVELVKYLTDAYPPALQVQDKEGNLPLHYATMLHGSDMIQVLLKAYPDACQVRNSRDRYPLHLLCDRYLDDDAGAAFIHQDDVQACVKACPNALQGLDRFGRTPLHLACNAEYLWRWDILNVLIQGYPAALLMKDKIRRTPLELAKHHGQSNISKHKKHSNQKNCVDAAHKEQYNLVLSSLAECTTREKRKTSFGFASWMSSPPSSPSPTTVLKTEQQKRKGRCQQQQKQEEQVVDLYNCYG